MARLMELDVELVLPLLDILLASPDAPLRSFAVEALFRRPTEKHRALLAARLNDPHPEVRVKARRALRELGARPDLREAVLALGTQALEGRDWRGQEQAALLLAQMDHKPAAPRLVELLKSDRGEVLVASLGCNAVPRIRRSDLCVTSIVRGDEPIGPGAPMNHALDRTGDLLTVGGTDGALFEVRLRELPAGRR